MMRPPIVTCLRISHAAVKHSVSQYVDGKVHTNGIESFWSMLKRGHKGTYHKMNNKHLKRYVDEFVGRHNKRPSDTIRPDGRLGEWDGRQAAQVSRPDRPE